MKDRYLPKRADLARMVMTSKDYSEFTVVAMTLYCVGVCKNAETVLESIDLLRRLVPAMEGAIRQNWDQFKRYEEKEQQQ